MQVRIFTVALTVIIQFMLELTVGRVFVAPSLIPFILIYLSENYEKFWALDGAFWTGICFDLLLHQPVGSSSLALLSGLYAAGILSRISSGEGKGYLVSMTVVAVLISDFVFILVASRPFGSGFSPVLLKVLPRAAVTALTVTVLFAIVARVTDIRARRVTG